MLRCPAGRSRSEPGLSRAGSGWDPHLRGLPGLQGRRAQPSETQARGGSCPAAPALPARATLCRRPRGCARDSAAKPAPPPGPPQTELSPGLSPSLAEVPGRAAAVDGGVWCVWSVQEGFSLAPRLPPRLLPAPPAGSAAGVPKRQPSLGARGLSSTKHAASRAQQTRVGARPTPPLQSGRQRRWTWLLLLLPRDPLQRPGREPRAGSGARSPSKPPVGREAAGDRWEGQ